MKLTKSVCAGTILALSIANAADAALSDWGRVVKVAQGMPVEVIHSGLKRLNGSLVNANQDEIVIRNAEGQHAIARKDVRRVSVSQKSRKKRTLLGLAIGAGAGAAAMAIGANAGDIDVRRDLVVGAGLALGGGGGAALGAALGGPTTVYRAP